MEIASYCTRSGRMSRNLGVGQIPFHHQVMSGDIDSIQDHRYRMSRRIFFSTRLKCASGTMHVGLHGPGWLYVLRIPPRRDLPLQTHRACSMDFGQGPNLRTGSGRGPACSLPATEPRARGKTHGRKRTKFRSAKNMHLCIVIQVSPSGCVRIEIPRVTQVNEKGHEGNTAVVTAYFEVYDKMKKCQLWDIYIYAGGTMEHTFHEE